MNLRRLLWMQDLKLNFNMKNRLKDRLRLIDGRFDDVVEGIIEKPSELSLIKARPGFGKTYFLAELAMAFQDEGFRVIYFNNTTLALNYFLHCLRDEYRDEYISAHLKYSEVSDKYADHGGSYVSSYRLLSELMNLGQNLNAIISNLDVDLVLLDNAEYASPNAMVTAEQIKGVEDAVMVAAGSCVVNTSYDFEKLTLPNVYEYETFTEYVSLSEGNVDVHTIPVSDPLYNRSHTSRLPESVIEELVKKVDSLKSNKILLRGSDEQFKSLKKYFDENGGKKIIKLRSSISYDKFVEIVNDLNHDTWLFVLVSGAEGVSYPCKLDVFVNLFPQAGLSDVSSHFGRGLQFDNFKGMSFIELVKRDERELYFERGAVLEGGLEPEAIDSGFNYVGGNSTLKYGLPSVARLDLENGMSFLASSGVNVFDAQGMKMNMKYVELNSEFYLKEDGEVYVTEETPIVVFIDLIWSDKNLLRHFKAMNVDWYDDRVSFENFLCDLGVDVDNGKVVDLFDKLNFFVEDVDKSKVGLYYSNEDVLHLRLYALKNMWKVVLKKSRDIKIMEIFKEKGERTYYIDRSYSSEDLFAESGIKLRYKDSDGFVTNFSLVFDEGDGFMIDYVVMGDGVETVEGSTISLPEKDKAYSKLYVVLPFSEVKEDVCIKYKK